MASLATFDAMISATKTIQLGLTIGIWKSKEILEEWLGLAINSNLRDAAKIIITGKLPVEGDILEVGALLEGSVRSVLLLLLRCSRFRLTLRLLLQQSHSDSELVGADLHILNN